MRAKLALKNIYRSWVRSLFIFILLAAVTCSLFSNVMEYTITRRETNKAIELYDGVGTMMKGVMYPSVLNQRYGEYIYADDRVSEDYYPEDYAENWETRFPYARLDNDKLAEIEQYEYISYVDKRYMTAGVSDEYQRIDMSRDYYYDFTNCYVVEGTVDMWHEGNAALLIKDFEIIAGGSSRTFERYDELWIKCEKEAPVYLDQEGKEFSPEIWTDGPVQITEKSRYQADFCRELEVGGRYVFVVRFSGHDFISMFLPELYLTDHFTYGWCDGVWSLDGEPDDYLETERFAPLKQYIEVIETDYRTFDMVYTTNMGAIRYFADGTIGISDGRRLNREDYLNGANVCVINHEMARVYGLEIGDTITMNLGNKLFEQYEGVGAVAVVPERLSTSYTEVTLEIVGIWKDTRNIRYKATSPDPLWSYSENTIFVPTHLLNVDETELENHTFTSGEYSFVIENVYDVEAFGKKYTQKIKDMRMVLTLDDGNWKEIEETFEESKTMALIKIGILAVAVLAATCFTVLLYILGRKRDFAIMRVLGAGKRKAQNTIVLPLMVITTAAVMVGTAAAWIYTVNNISVDFNISQMSEYVTDTSVPPWLVIACILAEIVLSLVIAYVILRFIGRKSPLALLQDSSQKKDKKKKKQQETVAEPEKVKLGEWVSLGKPNRDGKRRRAKFVWRYVVRNINRTIGKSLMYILVSALLLNVAGQISILQDTFSDAFNETEVVSKYAGSLNLYYVNKLQESGYVRDVYYQSQKWLDINTVPVTAYFTNDIDRLTGKEQSITFLDGYDKSVMQTHEPIIIMTEASMDAMDIQLGDTVYIMAGWQYDNRLSSLAWGYMPDDGSVPYDEAKQLAADEAMEWYMEKSDSFKVIGCMESDLAGAYLPGTMEMSTVHGKLVIMQLTEGILIDNWKTKEYREFGEKLADANLTYQVAFIMDTSKVEYLANIIKLLELLYPVAVIAMLVIGIFMTSLIIVQTSKDIAIMRVLGTSKRRTRVIIILERMLLCFVGMVLAAIIMFAMRGVTAAVAQKIVFILTAYFAAVIAASAIASMAATRKNVLELLQTKE